MLGLCAAKRFQDGGCQNCNVSANLKVCDTHFLIENMLRTARLGFRQMLELTSKIQAPLPCRYRRERNRSLSHRRLRQGPVRDMEIIALSGECF
jgi:hypothetical protein